MRVHCSFIILAAVVSVDLGLALPAQPEEANPSGPEEAVPSIRFLDDNLSTSSSKEMVTRKESDLELLAANNDQYSITCSESYLVYYWNWWPLVNDICEFVGDSMNRSFDARYPASHRWADNSKSANIKWDKVEGKDNCTESCRQIYQRIRASPDCREEDYWMKEKAAMTIPGCGVASYWIEYQLSPTPDHGTGLCWETPVPPTYLRDTVVVRQFCEAAVTYIQDEGVTGFLNLQERPGFFWTDYGRKIGRPENSDDWYASGFVHFWVKPMQFANTCGKGQNVEDMIPKVNVDQCVKWISAAEDQTCGAPDGLRSGGRFWADCFEWGILASGYDGLAGPSS